MTRATRSRRSPKSSGRNGHGGRGGSAPTVTDRRQARLLTDPRSAGFIYPFLGRERSMTEAASEAGCVLTTMAYRVRVLRDVGLVVATRTVARAGRPITYYRSSQDSYRVDLEATHFTDHRDQVRRIGAPIYRRISDAYAGALARHGSAVRVIGRDDAGGVYSTDLPPYRTVDRRPLLFEDRHLQLTRRQAEMLCAELDRAIARAVEDVGDGSPRHDYAVMVAAVPLQDR